MQFRGRSPTASLHCAGLAVGLTFTPDCASYGLRIAMKTSSSGPAVLPFRVSDQIG